MKKTDKSKIDIRNEIAWNIKRFTADDLSKFSEEVIATLQITSAFQEAHCILAYYSLTDEVDTHALLQDYCADKRFVLPVVEGDELLLKEYRDTRQMKKGALGVLEPIGDIFTDLKSIDLVLVPGRAFDRKLNRIGRGKGYYDRLLPQLSCAKVGICFDFQLLDHIPIGDWDIKMDMIVAQNEIIVG
jgi:5-formyltetrahydrofolate cyclo-ligase